MTLRAFGDGINQTIDQKGGDGNVYIKIIDGGNVVLMRLIEPMKHVQDGLDYFSIDIDYQRIKMAIGDRRQ